jgi:ribosomal protein S18 acetylase RimI-like enzyme
LWDTEICSIYDDLAQKKFSSVYLVVAKDRQQHPLGLAVFIKENIKEHFKNELSYIIDDGSLDSITTTDSEIFVELVAVGSQAQKMGIGKTLLFSIFDRCPSIKKLYLNTRVANKNAQGFYEHLGFKRLVRAVKPWNTRYADFWREILIYGFQKEQ